VRSRNSRDADRAALDEHRAVTSVEILTPREREILGLLALGLTNNEIAKKLYLSVRTVETHRANLQTKLRISRRSGLVAFAGEQGLRAN
jgi:two-component system, NarL family, response regulator NreC